MERLCFCNQFLALLIRVFNSVVNEKHFIYLYLWVQSHVLLVSVNALWYSGRKLCLLSRTPKTLCIRSSCEFFLLQVGLVYFGQFLWDLKVKLQGIPLSAELNSTNAWTKFRYFIIHCIVNQFHRSLYLRNCIRQIYFFILQYLLDIHLYSRSHKKEPIRRIRISS